MTMFGSSWLEDSVDDGPMVPSSWKEEVYIEGSTDQYELCRQLRRKTGMGLLNAKACLEDNNWNLKQAYENHRAYMWDGKLRNNENE